MARTPSTMLDLGTSLPDFTLPDTVSGATITSTELQGQAGTLVMFICNHCPFVIHVKEELANIGRDYGEKDIKVVAISSNDVENYPADSPDKMKAFAAESGFTFPYLYDADQEVALAFRAACTPDFYVFNAEGKLVYRGQLDASRPGNDIPVSGADLRAALDAVVAGNSINPDQVPSLGCNIKWKAGNEPDYFGS